MLALVSCKAEVFQRIAFHSDGGATLTRRLVVQKNLYDQVVKRSPQLFETVPPGWTVSQSIDAGGGRTFLQTREVASDHISDAFIVNPVAVSLLDQQLRVRDDLFHKHTLARFLIPAVGAEVVLPFLRSDHPAYVIPSDMIETKIEVTMPGTVTSVNGTPIAGGYIWTLKHDEPTSIDFEGDEHHTMMYAFVIGIIAVAALALVGLLRVTRPRSSRAG